MLKVETVMNFTSIVLHYLEPATTIFLKETKNHGTLSFLSAQ